MKIKIIIYTYLSRNMIMQRNRKEPIERKNRSDVIIFMVNCLIVSDSNPLKGNRGY